MDDKRIIKYLQIKRKIKTNYYKFISKLHTYLHPDNHHQRLGGQLHGGTTSREDRKPKYEPVYNPKLDKHRKLFITDWDDTVVDWNSENKTRLQNFRNVVKTHQPTDQLDFFPGVFDTASQLNQENITTIVISNKSHYQLINQTDHQKLNDKFDVIVGVDRDRRIDYVKPTGLLSKYALEQAGIEFFDGMEPVQVVFAGDNPRTDGKAAHKVDTYLKQYNRESFCKFLLVDSHNLQSKDKILDLPISQQPDMIFDGHNDYTNGNIFRGVMSALQPTKAIMITPNPTHLDLNVIDKADTSFAEIVETGPNKFGRTL